MNLTDAAYEALKMYAARARACGLALVYGAFEEYINKGGSPAYGDHTGDVLTGVCAIGAYNLTASDNEVLPLPKNSDAADAAWDGIEHGWDTGILETALNPEGQLHPAEWVAVGARLRAELNPRSARLP